MTLERFASIAHENVHTDGLNERGSEAALNVPGGSMNSTFSTLGDRQSIGSALRNGMTGATSVTPRWRHALGDVVPVSVLFELRAFAPVRYMKKPDAPFY